MSDITITSIKLNGNVQDTDSQGSVNMNVSLSVEESETNDGFVLNLGTEETTLKTTGSLTIGTDGKIDTEDSFQNDNAIVRAETIKDLSIEYNKSLEQINNAVERVNEKATYKHIGNGYLSGACFSFVDVECRQGLVKFGLLDYIKEKGYDVTLSITPNDIINGYGYEVDGNRYKTFSIEDLKSIRDNDGTFCNNSYSKDRLIFKNPNASESVIREDFKKSLKWFEANGLQSCAFTYPYGYQQNVRNVVKYYEDYAIGETNGVNGNDTDTFNLYICPVTSANTSEVISTIANASANNGWIIFMLSGFGKSETSAYIQKTIIDNIENADKMYNIQHLSLPEAIRAKAKMFSIDSDYDFYLQKNGLLRATLDEQSVSGLTNQLKFENLSDEFKKQLYNFCFSLIGDIPASSITMSVDGNPYTSGYTLERNHDYAITYELSPVCATPETNKVEIYVAETSQKTAIYNDGILHINKASVIEYSDVDGNGKDGVTITSDGTSIRPTTTQVTLIARVTNMAETLYTRFYFFVK